MGRGRTRARPDRGCRGRRGWLPCPWTGRSRPSSRPWIVPVQVACRLRDELPVRAYAPRAWPLTAAACAAHGVRRARRGARRAPMAAAPPRSPPAPGRRQRSRRAPCPRRRGPGPPRLAHVVAGGVLTPARQPGPHLKAHASASGPHALGLLDVRPQFPGLVDRLVDRLVGAGDAGEPARPANGARRARPVSLRDVRCHPPVGVHPGRKRLGGQRRQVGPRQACQPVECSGRRGQHSGVYRGCRGASTPARSPRPCSP